MPERLIARQTGGEIPLDLRKEFQEIQQVEVDGRMLIYGINKQTKKRKQIGYKKLIKAFQHDPEAKFKPEPTPGFWNDSGGETAIMVIGNSGKVNAKKDELLRIAGSDELVPRKQIRWLKPETGGNGEIAELKRQMGELERQVQAMETRLTEVLKLNSELETANQELRARNAELENELRDYRGIADEPGSIAVATQPHYIDSDHRLRRSWNIASGWLGRRLAWGQADPSPDFYVGEQDGKPRVTIRQEIVDGYNSAERRRGNVAAIVGGVAILGAAALVAGAWLGGGQKKANIVTTTIEAVPPAPATIPAGNHQASFKGLEGFKVSLPANWSWDMNTNGSYRIDDAAGRKVVPHVMWDRQGNLDVNTRQLLRQDPYEHIELKQAQYEYHTPGTNFYHHYETVVQDS